MREKREFSDLKALNYFTDGDGIYPEKKPDYEQVIDRIFERIREKGIFSECDLSLRGWNRMQKIFKEEKLYYDFLR